MTWRDPASEVRRLLRQLDARAGMLDADTANAVVDGVMSPEDAPPELRDLGEMVTQLRAAPTETELADEAASIATIAAAIRIPSPAHEWRPTPGPRQRRRGRTTIAVLVGTMTLFGGLAAANALPGSVQRVTADVLGTVGVSVPSPGGAGLPRPPSHELAPPGLAPTPGAAAGGGTVDAVTAGVAVANVSITAPDAGLLTGADARSDGGHGPGGSPDGSTSPPNGSDGSDHADPADHSPHDDSRGPGGPGGNQVDNSPDHGHGDPPGGGKGHGSSKGP